MISREQCTANLGTFIVPMHISKLLNPPTFRQEARKTSDKTRLPRLQRMHKIVSTEREAHSVPDTSSPLSKFTKLDHNELIPPPRLKEPILTGKAHRRRQHMLTERRRRRELSDAMDNLRKVLPDISTTSSKWEIVGRAIEAIDKLVVEHKELILQRNALIKNIKSRQ